MTDIPRPANIEAHWAKLVSPLTGPDPAGLNLIQTPEYRQLREFRSEDDFSLPMGAWERSIKRVDWASVEHLSTDLLCSRSKDLMIAAWLGEAWTHRYGLLGFHSALELVTELLERYPSTLYPREAGEDIHPLANPLIWLMKNYRQLVLRHIALAKDESGADITLDRWHSIQNHLMPKGDPIRQKAILADAQTQHREICESLKKTDLKELQSKLRILNYSHRILERLGVWVDSHLDDDNQPSMFEINETIDRWQTMLLYAMRMRCDAELLPPASEDPRPLEDSTEEPLENATAKIAENPVNEPVTLTSRQQAYVQLQIISRYLKEVEPHSPVPYLLDTAVKWGSMSLHVLLEDFAAAGNEEKKIWQMLGII